MCACLFSCTSAVSGVKFNPVSWWPNHRSAASQVNRVNQCDRLSLSTMRCATPRATTSPTTS